MTLTDKPNLAALSKRCPHGHRRTEENTVYHDTAEGRKLVCRDCRRETQQQQAQERAAHQEKVAARAQKKIRLSLHSPISQARFPTERQRIDNFRAQHTIRQAQRKTLT